MAEEIISYAEKNFQKKIRRTYEKRLSSLDINKQRHFALRMYRITGEKNYIQPVLSDCKLAQYKLLEKTQNLNNNDYILAKSQKFFDKYKAKDKRHKARKKMYNKNKVVLFNANLIHLLANFKSLGLDKIFKKEFEKAFDYISKIDIKEQFLLEEIVRLDQTKAINTVYCLYYLGLFDFRKQIKEKFLSLKNWLYINKIYGLTHFIIAASYFYQRFVSANDYQWILDYFKKNIDEIIKKTNPDIVAEVGLCFKLCQKKDKEIFNKVKNYLYSCYDKKLGYIPNEKNPKDPQLAEHRNIIAYLFLSDFKKLYPGPDLSSLFAKR